MATTITIDAAGRVVIPKDVRDRYRLSAGSQLDLTDDEGRILLTPTGAGVRIIERGGRLILDLGQDEVDVDHRSVRDSRLEHLIA